MHQDKDIKHQDELKTSIHPHTDAHLPTQNTKTNVKEGEGVRRENSWRPGGESESRREFVGVQKQKLLPRIYINSPSSFLLGLNSISSNNTKLLR